MSIGIVLPVYNEAKILNSALDRLKRISGNCRVLVVDGGSSDGSAALARRYFQTEVCPCPNRGAQMNLGAHHLKTDVLLFLHVDSQLPPGFEFYIDRALRDPTALGGCFQLSFDARHPMLHFYSWCTRFRGRFFHFGDQGFFVRQDIFERMLGYRELPFLEDLDFLRRLLRHGRFVVLPVHIVTSARRFLRRGIVSQQLANILVVILFELGVSASRLARLYPAVREP